MCDSEDFTPSTRRPTSPEARREEELALRRAFAGTSADWSRGGPPTRLPSGEWMQRICLDLPEAMRTALEEHAGSGQDRIGEIIRAALVAAGIGEASHVAGICDGTYADDGEHQPNTLPFMSNPRRGSRS